MVFEDNRLAPVLYGEQNGNLHQIEKALSVQITSRGNEIIIDGKQANHARAILESLWLKLQQGQDVDKHTVDSALRFFEDSRGGSNSNGSGGKVPDADVRIVTQKKKIQPRTPIQSEYIRAMEKNKLVFGVGPAGTGKTYMAVAMAVSMLERGEVERIILSRPAVEAGERLGFLPGEMREKMDPYMRPLYDALHDTMAVDKVQKKLATEEIEIAPLAFMRGRTLNNAFIILDEAQNSTNMQMLMFLTRMGENSHMVITGDPSQIDLPPNTHSGLLESRETLQGIEDIAFINFTSRDVVRDKLVSKIIEAYDARRKKDAGTRD
ncbi:MAG: PhoH family protein [Rhodospirillales bacterium]|nr:PhoH family protein [Rhodospirillales bacterium]MCB9995782.1 PhoH family protein [Rhodospirillales bacterium]